MYFSSPTSNITPALVSVAMTRSDSRDSTTSNSSYTSTPAMQVSYSHSPSTSYSHRSSSSSISMPSTTSWLPSPYRSCMLHSSTSSQGYTTSQTSSYISDDDLLALDDLAMPPIEYISSPTSAPRQPKRELTTEEQIAMLQEMQEREQGSSQRRLQQQQMMQQQQRTVRFAPEQRKTATRRVSGASQRRATVTSKRV